MSNKQKLLQIADDVGEPRRSVVIAAAEELNDLARRNVELFRELEQVKKVANDHVDEVHRLKCHIGKCTGIPASVGLCEPVEGYAKEPIFLYSAVKAMAEMIRQQAKAGE